MITNYLICARNVFVLLLLTCFADSGAIDRVKKSTETTAEPIEIRIGHPKDILQGHYTRVTITLNAQITRLDGFDLLLSYDPKSLTFKHTLPGQLLIDNNWEYFSYQILGDTTNDSLAFINIMATADIPYLNPDLPDSADQADGLVDLYFYISNARTYECRFLPVRFFWRGCDDNLIFMGQGDTIALAQSVYEKTHEVWGRPPEPEYPLPPEGCRDSINRYPVPMIDFVNGGFDVVCVGDNPNPRGDLNCNGVAFERADEDFYIRLLVDGVDFLNPYVAECCIYASDVNCDGITLTAADLQRLVRIINGDAEPYPKPLDNVFLTIDTLTYFDQLKVYCSSDEQIGATLFTFTVNDTTALPLLEQAAPEMDLEYAYRGDTLKVLIYSLGSSMIPAGTGEVLTIPTSASPVLIAVDAAEFQGWLMKADF